MIDIKFLDRLDAESRSAMEERQRKWEEFLALYRGKFFPEKRPAWRVSPVLNFLMSTVERKVAYMTDTRPQLSVVARDDAIQDTAEVLTETIKALWEEKDWLQALAELIYFAAVFGTGFAAAVWDNEADFGYGDIEMPVIDPRTVYFDPFILRTYNLDSGEYIIYEHFVTTEELKLRYPQFAHLIPAFYEPKEESRWKTALSKIIKLKEEKGFKPAIARSLVKEYWIKDRTIERDEEGNVVYEEERKFNRILPVKKPKLRYPTGRHIVRVGNVILDDSPNVYVDGKFPLDMLSWHFDPDSPFGISEIEALQSIQQTFVKIIEIITENAMLMTNAIWIGDIDALHPEDWEKLRNKPGGFVKKRPGKELVRASPPPLPVYVQNYVLYLERAIEKLSGMTDVTYGKRVGGVTSGIAIDSLQQAAQSVIRLKARDVEAFLQRIGQKLIARILQYYTDDRIIHILGEDRKFKQYKFVREKMIKPLKEYYKFGDNVPQSVIAAKAFRDLKFKIVPGSSLAIAKMPKIYMALALFNLGVIDDEALLDVVEFPNREEVLRRTQEKRRAGLLPGRPRRARLPFKGFKTRKPPTGIGELEEVFG